MTTGMIMDILRGSIHDGPGIRTTVFLKGCPLHCLWCHNPEGMKGQPQLRFDGKKCIQCGKCKEACPQGVHEWDSCGHHHISFSRCLACGKCAKVCPENALSVVGHEMTSKEVLELVKKDMAFYQKTGGGITLSGGEPLIQPEFSIELLSECQKLGIHRAVETAGNVPWETIEATIGLVDLYLFDYKASTEEMQQKYTGGSRELIMANLERLSAVLMKTGEGEIWLRCPIIPGVNDSEEHFKSIRAVKENCLGVEKIEIMPYHELGIYKWEQIGLTYDPEIAGKKAPSKKEAEDWKNLVL